jgi:hypothetical protein
MSETKELRELVGFVAEATGVIVTNGKLTDLKNIGNIVGAVIPLIPKIGPAFAGISSIPGELAELNESDAKALIQEVKVKADLDDDSAAEELAGAILELIPAVVKVVDKACRFKSEKAEVDANAPQPA